MIKMPRTYRKLTERTFPENSMKNAVIAVLRENVSIRKSAERYQIKKSRLCNYVQQARQIGIENMSFGPNFKKKLVFTSEMEKRLSEYLIKCSKMFYGLTPTAVKRLAYEYAKKNSLKFPDKWEKDQQAGRDWLSGFLKRNVNLSIRTPEATSLARMTSFNKTNIEPFFDKLQLLIQRYSLTSSQIYNLDETGVTTVQRVQKVITRKGLHQVGQATSRERGELITQVGIICANGTALPPVWVFPRQRFDEKRMMQGLTETGALGLVYKTGWMTCENFINVLKHIVKHTHCSLENRILLILDNHESHVSINSVDYCRENGITLLTLPPHTSNKTQPLDRTVFGPFKTFLNQACDGWMISHPAQTLTIYDLPPLCSLAWDRAANPVNIKSGFRCTGIWPYDRNVFSEDEFLSSSVTDRPTTSDTPQTTPDISRITSETSLITPVSLEATPSTSQASPSHLHVTPETEETEFVSPEVVRPYPKAAPRKTNRRGPPKRKSIIATDTPEKEDLIKRKTKTIPPKVKQAKRKVVETSSESEPERWKETDSDDDDVDIFGDLDDTNYDNTNVEVGKYAVVKVYRNKSTEARHFVAKVREKLASGYEVEFYSR
ncbi:uncharacterized protein LOC116165574 [Photinus pyralis]|uniref:uncharacterized protein LOC116165574 n=1 Tax=Photinus pyralis TaxID=7054 RepID=UPI00126766DA|nr:uncharacterized protein LOC116165574 [Photinus pyralis]